MSMDDFISIKDIPIGSIWMAADGGSYGYIVQGKKDNGDVVCRGFSVNGWYEDNPFEIDWFKLQYRYYLVKG
jgi:hypothetical protein